ncbi:general transcription factor 3C polypeptide 1-like isoform X2 [Montipora capricornis]|uniref:general transcription factor 3C polypeptide 1-like isoform X2 n=1 Tax=Montipora capricornis TaxID=246305 RepID=UPI0035F126C2
MEAFLSCMDEIALDGFDGCPIEQLWKHLEVRKPPFPLKLDAAAKQFLWKAIVDMSEVEFFVLEEPFSHVFSKKCNDMEAIEIRPKNPHDQYVGPLRDSNEFKLICDQDLGVRGSCPSYHERKNITEVIREQAVYQNLETVYERWGDCLVMVASQELREKALLGPHCDPNMTVIDMQYCLLEHVGQARYNGRMQRAISSNFLKMEAKSLFHYLKGLRLLGLITLQPVIITTTNSSKAAFIWYEGGKNYITNVIRLKRFHVQELHRYDVLATSLTRLLMEAPNQELPLSEIQKRVTESKKVLKNVRRYLQQAGYVVEEKILGEAPGEASEEASFAPRKKKRKKTESTGVVCPSAYPIKIRLVKPFVLKSNNIWQPSDDEEEGDDNGDDDDDESKEKDSWGGEYQVNLVAERPLVTQVYDAIYRAGAKGCTMKLCQRAVKLPIRELRNIVNDMKRKKLVQEVLQDVAKTKVAWIVATPFVASNIQTKKVKEVQDQLKQMEKKTLEQQDPKSLSQDTPLQALSPSPATSEGLDQKEIKIPPRNKSMIVKRVTYRKLRRKQLILEYIENKKVVEGCFPFQKDIMSSELEEGQEGKIDRKVVYRFLEECIAEGLIKKLSSVVNHELVTQKVDLYLHPSINNDSPKVAYALQQCRERIKEESLKAAERQEKAKQCAEEKEKKKLEREAAAAAEKEKKKTEAQKKGQQEKDDVVSSESSVKKASSDGKERAPVHKYSLLPRFYRAQAIHELLWVLVYGDICQQETSNEDFESEMYSGMEESLDHSDNWIKFLKPLAKVCNEDGTPLLGWFRFSDVLQVMPVTILCRSIDIAGEIEGFDEYASDPANRNVLLGDLPQPLKGRVFECGRFKSGPSNLLTNLAHIGLVTPLLPLPHILRDAKIFLSKGVKLLDTRTSIPAYHTVCPPPEKSFEMRTHLFTTMAAVRSYWRDLNCVCLNTPLGLVRTDEALESNVKNRRLLQFGKEEIDEGRVELPPGDNLGAGGLDRCLFSHLQKNWTRLLTKSNVGIVQRKRKSPIPTVAVEEEAVSSGSDQVPQKSQKKIRTLGTAETKKLAKKGKGPKKMRKRKAEESPVSQAVKKRRTDSSDKAKSPKHRKDPNGPLSKDGHSLAFDEEDRNILARKANERITFSAEEDSWLLLFQSALVIMKYETPLRYPFICMRNILHKACATSFDKTGPSIKRRIQKLMRNTHSQMTIKICIAECAQDESFQEFGDPQAEFEVTFKEVVKRLRQKFSSSSLSCDGDPPLVSSVKELHEKYKVQAFVAEEPQVDSSDESILSLGPAISSVADITKAAIRDQIQIAFTTSPELYDAYRVFQMFNSFTWEELHAVFKDMQNKNLVTRKRSVEHYSAQLMRSLPFASLTFQLSIVYHRLFMEGSKLDRLTKEFITFLNQLVKGEEHTLLGIDAITITDCCTRSSNDKGDNSVEGNGATTSMGSSRDDGPRSSSNICDKGTDKSCGSDGLPSGETDIRTTASGVDACSDSAGTESGTEDSKSSNAASTSRKESSSNTDSGSISCSGVISSISGTTSKKGVGLSSSRNGGNTKQQPVKNLTPGVIEIKPKCTLGGHVACVLSLLVTGKASVEVNIPDEILNMDPSELAESAVDMEPQQQTAEDIAEASVQSSTAASSEKSNDESDASLAMMDGVSSGDDGIKARKASGKGTERIEMSPAVATVSKKGKKGVQWLASTKGKVRTKSGGKGKAVAASTIPRDNVTLEEREVFTLKLPSSIVTKFTSASEMEAVKESTSYLTSCSEIVKVARPARSRTVPVASLSKASFSSRSSRTMLMLARGGKDPYDHIKQLPARALNTHDFMSLYPCKNKLRITNAKWLADFENGLNLADGGNTYSEAVSEANSVSETASMEERNEIETGEHSMQTQRATSNPISASLGQISSDFLTCPVILSPAMSLEDYLDQKKKELGFNEMDSVLVRNIQEIVSSSKEIGVSVAQLKERICGSKKRELPLSHYSIEQHFEYMCAAKLLYRVGICELRLVTPAFVKPWSMSLLKPKKDSQKLTEKEATSQEGEKESMDSQETNDVQDDNFGATKKTSQPGSTSTEKTVTVDSSVIVVEETAGEENGGTTEQAGSPLESSGDSEKKQSKGQGYKKPKISNYESYSVVCRPWITIDGTTSQPLLSMFRNMVLMIILKNPGISESQIANRVYDALRPVPLHEILESLLRDGCIIKQTRMLPPKFSLFSSSKQAESSQVMTFFTPAVDCLIKRITNERSR